MSTTTAPPPAGTSPPPPPQTAAGARVPLGRLVRVELRKTLDTRAGRWLLISIALLTAAVVVIFFFAADESALTFDNFINATGTPQGFLLPVLGILAITSEWSQRTTLVTFALEPSRTRVVLAKLLALAILGLAVVAIAYALAALGNVCGMALRDGDGSWNYQVDWVGEIALGQLIGLVQGLAFGMVLLNSAAAIVIYYVLPIVWGILFNAVSALQSAAPWVDAGTASTPLFSHEMGPMSWVHVAVTTAIWVGVPLAIGFWRVRRTEVK